MTNNTTRILNSLYLHSPGLRLPNPDDGLDTFSSTGTVYEQLTMVNERVHSLTEYWVSSCTIVGRQYHTSCPVLQYNLCGSMLKMTEGHHARAMAEPNMNIERIAIIGEVKTPS
jgi:hypothetical protein